MYNLWAIDFQNRFLGTSSMKNLWEIDKTALGSLLLGHDNFKNLQLIANEKENPLNCYFKHFNS